MARRAVNKSEWWCALLGSGKTGGQANKVLVQLSFIATGMA